MDKVEEIERTERAGRMAEEKIMKINGWTLTNGLLMLQLCIAIYDQHI